MMNGRGKSDRPAVPEKPPNAKEPAAEVVEGRGRTKGNSPERNALRTQSRGGVLSALERVRQVARRDRKQRFTALLHHVYDVARLRAAYFAIKEDAAAGVDGETWKQYGEKPGRQSPGSVRTAPARSVPSQARCVGCTFRKGRAAGPLGVPALEDKIVQRAVSRLNAIYEEDFLGFSTASAKRSPHQALDALAVGIGTRKVNWVLDADIRRFFDTLDHGWLVKFVEHRVADRRVVRLIQKWLKAGVLEEGKRIQSEVGTVQGGSISPLLSNIYLHYVFDLWVQRWRQKQARGDVIVVRFADDFVGGLRASSEAERFLTELRERFAKFGLELHAEKTRLIEFGRFAEPNRRRRDRRQTGDLQLPGLYAQLREDPERVGSRCCARRCAGGGRPS